MWLNVYLDCNSIRQKYHAFFGRWFGGGIRKKAGTSIINLFLPKYKHGKAVQPRPVLCTGKIAWVGGHKLRVRITLPTLRAVGMPAHEAQACLKFRPSPSDILGCRSDVMSRRFTYHFSRTTIGDKQRGSAKAMLQSFSHSPITGWCSEPKMSCVGLLLSISSPREHRSDSVRNSRTCPILIHSPKTWPDALDLQNQPECVVDSHRLTSETNSARDDPRGAHLDCPVFTS
jgi:hypothetical protein